jgi:hypothetical protein
MGSRESRLCIACNRCCCRFAQASRTHDIRYGTTSLLATLDVPPITTIGKRLAEEFRHFLGIAQNVTATLDVHVVKDDAASQ